VQRRAWRNVGWCCLKKRIERFNTPGAVRYAEREVLPAGEAAIASFSPLYAIVSPTGLIESENEIMESSYCRREEKEDKRG
jgi:hypothetical protein